MQRRQRLSRSRDFEAVYRHGRSVATRYLILYWFPRTEPAADVARLGIAVPKKVGGAVVRNRLKRQLKEIWRALPNVPDGHDYVLVARPGLADAAEARGFPWLGERVSELVSRAAGA